MHRMNVGDKVWGALKSVPSNRGLEINDKKCVYEGVDTNSVQHPMVVRSRGIGCENC